MQLVWWCNGYIPVIRRQWDLSYDDGKLTEHLSYIQANQRLLDRCRGEIKSPSGMYRPSPLQSAFLKDFNAVDPATVCSVLQHPHPILQIQWIHQDYLSGLVREVFNFREYMRVDHTLVLQSYICRMPSNPDSSCIEQLQDMAYHRSLPGLYTNDPPNGVRRFPASISTIIYAYLKDSDPHHVYMHRPELEWIVDSTIEPVCLLPVVCIKQHPIQIKLP